MKREAALTSRVSRLTPDSLSFFAVAPPGFEDLVEAELRGLGLRDVTREAGGVGFRGAWGDAYRANLWSRVASRVLVRVAAFSAGGFRDLARELGCIAWEAWLPLPGPVDIRVSSQGSSLYHTGKVAETVLGALGPDAAPSSSVEGACGRLLVRIQGRQVTVSLDVSGEHLHRRGYRLQGGPAPLRENLAAGLVMRAGLGVGEPFLDPLCGAGTLALEAALIQQGRAPGLGRKFAFEALPSFSPELWRSLREEAQAAVRTARAGAVYASDRDTRAVERTAQAARRAGLAEQIQVAVADVDELEPPETAGLLVTNPPYGHRLRGAGQAYEAVGRALRGRFRGWRWGIVVGSPHDSRTLGLRPREVHPFRNGGLRLRFAVGG